MTRHLLLKCLIQSKGQLKTKRLKISILCDSEQATQAISFGFDMTSVSPEKRIRFNMHEWRYIKHVEPKARYRSLFDCSYLILSRWYQPGKYAKIFNESHKRNKKVFLHLDDFLFGVPKSIGIAKWAHYNSATMLDSLRETAHLADGIISSTPRLTRAIHDIFPKLTIYTCPVYKTFAPPDHRVSGHYPRPYPVIGYMGTSSHKEDLELICPAIDSAMKKNTTLVFETFGLEMPATLSDKYSNRCIALDKVSSYREFQALLLSRGWWLGLAPLTENKFNNCKANTKLVEYIQAGVPVLASDFGPYQGFPWTSTSKDSRNEQEWSEKIEEVLYSAALRTNIYQQQVMYCENLGTANSLVEFYRSLNEVRR